MKSVSVKQAIQLFEFQIIVHLVPRLLPSQLRPPELATHFPAADAESFSHLGHQPRADLGRFTQLGSGRDFGLRYSTESDQLSYRRG